jgi:hypothetical protein
VAAAYAAEVQAETIAALRAGLAQAVKAGTLPHYDKAPYNGCFDPMRGNHD